MNIAYDYAENFSSDHAMKGAVLEVGGLFKGREEVHLLKVR